MRPLSQRFENGGLRFCVDYQKFNVITKVANTSLAWISIASNQNEQQDSCAVGLLMVHLMELGTSLESPGSFILQDPDKWEESIKNFLQETQHATGDNLVKVR